MAKRLGFWNRLAIVLGAVTTFAAPTIIALNIQKDSADLRVAIFESCTNAASASNEPKGWEKCWQEFDRRPIYSPWDDFWEMAVATAIICAVVYLLIWAVTQTIRWIWAGRE